MRKVILVLIISLSMFQMGCSALKCGCGEEKAPEAKSSSCSAGTDAEKKGCGCSECKHAAGESCSMKK